MGRDARIVLALAFFSFSVEAQQPPRRLLGYLDYGAATDKDAAFFERVKVC